MLTASIASAVLGGIMVGVVLGQDPILLKILLPEIACDLISSESKTGHKPRQCGHADCRFFGRFDHIVHVGFCRRFHVQKCEDLSLANADHCCSPYTSHPGLGLDKPK